MPTQRSADNHSRSQVTEVLAIDKQQQNVYLQTKKPQNLPKNIY